MKKLFGSSAVYREEVLYDRMKTACIGVDERGETVWNPVVLDIARYGGFAPRLCRPYRAQTKGKVESGVKYVRRNFLCRLLGQEPGGLEELNARPQQWVQSIANQRIKGTTHEAPALRWTAERKQLRPANGRAPYPYVDEELRRVARDAYVAWQGSRYSVPWSYAGKEVCVHERGTSLEIHYGSQESRFMNA